MSVNDDFHRFIIVLSEGITTRDAYDDPSLGVIRRGTDHGFFNNHTLDCDPSVFGDETGFNTGVYQFSIYADCTVFSKITDLTLRITTENSNQNDIIQFQDDDGWTFISNPEYPGEGQQRWGYTDISTSDSVCIMKMEALSPYDVYTGIGYGCPDTKPPTEWYFIGRIGYKVLREGSVCLNLEVVDIWGQDSDGNLIKWGDRNKAGIAVGSFPFPKNSAPTPYQPYNVNWRFGGFNTLYQHHGPVDESVAKCYEGYFKFNNP